MRRDAAEHLLRDGVAGGGFTRRRFLQLLGAVGGTGLMMAGMDGLGMGIASAQNRPPDLSGPSNGRRVIILGAGVAGMTAAYELQKYGYETPILEARNFAGGRNQTARNGFTLSEIGGATQRCRFDEGQYLNHGPWRIPFHHRSTLHYCDELDVPLQIMVNENDNAYILYEDVDSPLSGQRIRLMEAKADLRGYTAELLAKAANQDQLDRQLSNEDLQLLIAYLVNEGALDADSLAYEGTSRRGYAEDPGAGLHSGEPSDPYDFLALLRSGVGDEFGSMRSYSQQYTMFQPIGGMDQLARGFQFAVGPHITYNAEVQEIRQDSDGVRIAYADARTGETREVEGDYCICTIPLPVLANIPADFDAAFQRAIQQVNYTPTGKIGLQFARRFWEEDDWIYGGHSMTNFFGDISYPSYGYQGRKGVIQGYYNFGNQAIEVSNLSPEGRTRYALENGSKLHPGAYMEEFENSFSVAWHRVPYSLGGWASWTEATRENAYPILNEPDGRVYLAGEHLSYLTGWQAGGIESAWIQIEKLHQRAAQEAVAPGSEVRG